MGESEEEPTGKPFPGYDFDTFDGCVAALGGEVDDPEGFCSWLEEEGKEALSDPHAQEVLSTLEVEFVSAVDTPAQDSEWLIAKDAEGPDGNTHRWQSEATLYVRKDRDESDDDVKQVAFAPVLIPKEADKQGDVIPAPAIEDAAHKYLSEYRKVDSDHDLRDGKGKPVESWTLKQDTTFERPDGTESRTYPEGTWVMGIKFDDETWGRVESGELNGLSIFGGAKPVDVDALLGKGIDGMNKSEDGDADGDGADGDADDQSMKNEDDPGDNTGNGDGESVEKQLDAGAVSEMLATVGEKDGVSGDTSITDFVKTLIQDGDVDDSEVRNMSVLLDGGASGGGSPDEGGDEGGDGGDGSDDEGIDLSDDGAGKSEDGDVDEDVDKGDDGGDADDPEDDVEKSAGDTDAGFEDAPEWAKALKSEVDDLREKVEDPPRSDKMENGDELSDRIVKDITGHEDADVARKALREQVEKSDGDDAPSVDYDGITDDEGADATAKSSGDSLPNSSAANTRMVGGDN